MTSGARSKKFHDIGILTQARLAISQIRVRPRPTLKAVRSGSDRQLARYHRIPAIYYERLFTTVGGLVSYGSRRAESNHQAGAYVGRILGGEKPGNLPVVQPTKFEFIINLKTAKTLGLTISNQMQLLADEVIE
jgi:hypothetical protein